MNRWALIDWKRVVFALVVIGLAIYIGFFWKQPRYGEEERFVQSNYQRNSGQWHRREVTGAELNQLRDDAEPLNRMVSAVLIVGGLALIVWELRVLKR